MLPISVLRHVTFLLGEKWQSAARVLGRHVSPRLVTSAQSETIVANKKFFLSWRQPRVLLLPVALSKSACHSSLFTSYIWDEVKICHDETWMERAENMGLTMLERILPSELPAVQLAHNNLKKSAGQDRAMAREVRDNVVDCSISMSTYSLPSLLPLLLLFPCINRFRGRTWLRGLWISSFLPGFSRKSLEPKFFRCFKRTYCVTADDEVCLVLFCWQDQTFKILNDIATICQKFHFHCDWYPSGTENRAYHLTSSIHRDPDDGAIPNVCYWLHSVLLGYASQKRSSCAASTSTEVRTVDIKSSQCTLSD